MKRIYKLENKVITLDNLLEKIKYWLEHDGNSDSFEHLGISFEDVDIDISKYTIEDIFWEVGCPCEVFDEKGHFTPIAWVYYQNALNFYVDNCGGTEDDFDKLCRENDCFDEEEV